MVGDAGVLEIFTSDEADVYPEAEGNKDADTNLQLLLNIFCSLAKNDTPDYIGRDHDKIDVEARTVALALCLWQLLSAFIYFKLFSRDSAV